MEESSEPSADILAPELPVPPLSRRPAWRRVTEHPRGQIGGAAFGGLAALAYLVTLVPGVSVGDSAEMQWVPYTLGVLHATGYPLYTLLGWAWARLIPTGSVAYRMNALSAMAGAAAVALVYMFARRVTDSAVAAALAALALLSSSLTWSQATVAEVYALHSLFVIGILYLLLRWAQDVGATPRGRPSGQAHPQKAGTGGPPPGQAQDLPLRQGDSPHADRWFLAAAFVSGLSLAHHRTTLLLAPAAIIFVFLVDRTIWRRGRLWLKSLGLLVPGLLLYLYVPWRFDGDAARTLDVMLGASFWKTFVALRPDWPDLVPRTLLDQFGWPGLLTGFLGLGWLLWRRRAVGILLLVYATTQAVFAVVYSVSDVAVFLLPVILVYALWIGAGVDAVWVGLGRMSWLRRPRAIAGALLVLTALALFVARLPDWAAENASVTARTEAEVQRIRSAAQRLAEPDAVLDVEAGIYGALLYHQVADGQPIAPGVQVYIPYDRTYYDQALAESATRPVYLMYSYDVTRVPAGYRLARQGEMIQITAAEAVTPTHPVQRPLTNDIELTGYDVITEGLVLHWQTSRPIAHDFGVWVHYFAADLAPAGQQDKPPEGQAYHYPPSHWPTDVPLLDLFDLPAGVTYVQVGLTRESPSLDVSTVIKVGPTVETGSQPVNVTLGQTIAFLGYDLTRQGELMRLTLYWQADRPVTRDYTVFVHCLDATGRIVTQRDQQPLGGFYPTSLWRPGEVIADTYELSPSSLCQRLAVGMYLWPSMEQLRPPTGDAVIVDLQP